MLKKPELQQQELEWVSIEALVPAGHLLRKVDEAVDFGFIRDRVKHLYSADITEPAALAFSTPLVRRRPMHSRGRTSQTIRIRLFVARQLRSYRTSMRA